MEIYDVVKKLIGGIDPVGDSGVDEKKYENLETHIELVYKLLSDLNDVARNKDRIEYSIKRAGKKAAYFLEILPAEFDLNIDKP